MTINVLSGVSGHPGHNAQLLVGKEREQGKELVMDLPLDSHLNGNYGSKSNNFKISLKKANWWRTSLSWSPRGERKL